MHGVCFYIDKIVILLSGLLLHSPLKMDINSRGFAEAARPMPVFQSMVLATSNVAA